MVQFARLGKPRICGSPRRERHRLAPVLPLAGHVRELENVISRAVLRPSAKAPRGEPIVISGHHLAADLGQADAAAPEPAQSTKSARLRSLRESAAAHKREIVLHALAEQYGNFVAAGAPWA